MPIMMLVIYGSIIAIMWFGGHMVDSGTLEIGLLTTFSPMWARFWFL